MKTENLILAAIGLLFLKSLKSGSILGAVGNSLSRKVQKDMFSDYLSFLYLNGFDKKTAANMALDGYKTYSIDRNEAIKKLFYKNLDKNKYLINAAN